MPCIGCHRVDRGFTFTVLRLRDAADYEVLRAPLGLVLLIVSAWGREVIRRARSLNHVVRIDRVDVEPSALAVQGIEMAATVPCHDPEIAGFTNDFSKRRDGPRTVEVKDCRLAPPLGSTTRTFPLGESSMPCPQKGRRGILS